MNTISGATNRLLGSTILQVVDRAEAAEARVSAKARVMAAAMVLAAGSVTHVGAQEVQSSADDRWQPSATETAASDAGVVRAVGAVIGGVAGAAATRGKGALTQVMGVLAGGYAGSALSAKVVGKEGTWQALRPLRTHDELVRRASVYSDHASPAGFRAPDPATHEAIYSLMFDAVAKRSVAATAKSDLDRAHLSRMLAQGKPEFGARTQEWGAAEKWFGHAMSDYSLAFQRVYGVLDTAHNQGIDVGAQRALMQIVPRDVKDRPTASLRWPGVDVRINEIVMERATADAGAKPYSRLLADAHAALQPAAQMPRPERPLGRP